MPEKAKTLSNEWFSSISTNTLSILVYGPTRFIAVWHAPDARLIENVLVSALNGKIWLTSAAWSWHSFQFATTQEPTLA